MPVHCSSTPGFIVDWIAGSSYGELLHLLAEGRLTLFADGAERRLFGSGQPIGVSQLRVGGARAVDIFLTYYGVDDQ